MTMKLRLMKLEEVMVGATAEELREMNKHLINKIKFNQALKAQDVKRKLKRGMKVEWNGRRGHSTGIIIEIKRTRAVVEHDITKVRWTVPMSMLTIVKE